MCIKLYKQLVEYIPHANINATLYTIFLWLPGVGSCWMLLIFTQFYNEIYKQIYYIHKLNAKQKHM